MDEDSSSTLQYELAAAGDYSVQYVVQFRERLHGDGMVWCNFKPMCKILVGAIGTAAGWLGYRD